MEIKLGKRIHTSRNDRGLTAEKLAEKCSINATYLRQIEGGIKLPSLSVFLVICRALEVSPTYLLQDSIVKHELSEYVELAQLLEQATPSQIELVLALLKTSLEKTKS